MKKTILNFLLGFCFKTIDTFIPKKNNFWGFSVHHIKSNQFVENARAVFEEIKTDTTIKKILFTRDNTKDFNIENAENFEIIKLMTFKGLSLFLQCKVLFVTHSLSMDYSYRYGESKFVIIKLNLNQRHLINLWHGIPLKRLYAVANKEVKEHLDRVKYRRYERKKYKGIICSSDVDSFAMTSIFYPIKYDNIWLTGLPRNDFLAIHDDKLPNYLRHQVQKIKRLKGNKKLIVYAPTYRQTTAVDTATYYQFTEQEIQQLKAILKKHNAILGFRMHYFRNNKSLFNLEDYIDNEYIFDMGHNVSAEIAPVIRESDIVITDYSSVFMEALYINKPVIGFTYDFDNYKNKQEGLMYDYDFVFPGERANDFKSLLDILEKELQNPQQIDADKYKMSKQFFYKFNDTNNAFRVVERVKKICKK